MIEKTILFLNGRTMNNKTPFILAAVALFAVFDAAAAPRHRSRGIGKEFSFPDAGIRIRVPAGAASQLLASPTVYATKKSDGTAMYRASELWRHLQTVAVWGGQGFSVELARVIYRPLPGKDALCSTDAAKRYKNAELAIIPGETHCYNNHLDQVVEEVRNWMVKQLG